MLLVTGASGFLGSTIVRMALERGLAPRCLVRPSSDLSLLKDVPESSVVRGDMSDPDSLARAVEGVDVVIHCAATTSQSAPDLDLSRKINVLGTRDLLKACEAAGVRRFVQISSQSAHPDNPSVYGRTKLEADRQLQSAAGIDWTILKPSIIYGPESKGIFDKMVQYCRKLPVIPMIGPGTEEMRPVLASEVAWVALACLDAPHSVGKTYDLGGADVLEFREFIQTILEAMGRHKPLVHLPIPVALGIARLLSRVMKNPPLTPDNVLGIQTVRHVDISAAQEDLGFNPVGFREGLRRIWGDSVRGRSGAHGASDLFERHGRATSVEEPMAAQAAAKSGVLDSPPPAGAPLRLAIVGLGKMGVMHAAMCGTVPGVEVAALVDLDPKLGSQLQSMGTQAPFFKTLGDLWTSGIPLDGVLIATPQFTHRAVGVECLERGLHVFCEKPLAHNLEDARLMARAAEARPELVTAIGFMKGHYALWAEAVRRLNSGWLGQPRRFRATVYLSQVFGPKKGWTFSKDKAGGGILINSGIHLVHFLCSLFGDVEKVKALARPMHAQVEDTLTALLEFRSGVFGSYDTSWSVPGYQTEGSTVLVECDEGTLEITDDWLRTYHISGGGEAPKGWSKTHRGDLGNAAFNLSPDYGGEGYHKQIADFADAIRQKRPARFDWREGLRIQGVVSALYESVETGNTIVVPDR